MESCASRSIPKSVATFSAVSGMESTPQLAFIRLLIKRQPMVVSWIALLRLKALSAFGMTKGARLMLSTPHNTSGVTLDPKAAPPASGSFRSKRQAKVTG